MSIRTMSAAGLACAVILAQAPVNNALTVQYPQRPRPADMARSSADMSAQCEAMMAEREKIMSDLKAADERLDEAVATMNAATGQAKVDATAEAVTQLAAQRKMLRGRTMAMQEGMMRHMMQHMQAGSDSMAMCPMMKSGAMK